MGEPRGKLEELIAELEGKKDEIMKQLLEYDLILPALQESLAKLDQEGIGKAAEAKATPKAEGEAPKIQEVPKPEGEEQPAEGEGGEEAAEVEAEAEHAGEDEEKQGEPARRSIASLVADEDRAAAKG